MYKLWAWVMICSFTMVVMITVDMMVLRTTMITTMKLYCALCEPRRGRDSSMKKRTDERTRTADLISLRVITQGLQGCAGACKCRIFRRISILWLALCCTVLRSRWYQSGINITHIFA